MSLILLHAGGCRALAPLAHRKDCKSIVADLAGDSGKLQQHSILCFDGFDFAGLSHLGVSVAQGGCQLLSDVSQLGFLHTLPGCGIQLKWLLQWCWEECELSCHKKKTGLELLVLHWGVIES